MARSGWTWVWFGLALCLVFASLVCAVEVFATGMARGDMIGAPPSFTPQGQQAMTLLERQNTIASDGVVISLLLAAICLGTGLHVRYQWSMLNSYGAALVICPVSAIAICLFLLALKDFFHS